jgi:hypothetical protein
MPTLNEARATVAPAPAAPKPKVEAPEGQTKAIDPKPQAPKTKAEPKPCACQVPGCDAKSTRKFAPGHDAKLKGYLTREVVAGNLTKEKAIEWIDRASGNSALLRGGLEAGIKRELAKVEAKGKREQAAKEKKDAETAAKADTQAAAVAASA